MEHCLCHNCNHPCAHLCKTAKSKGRKGKKDVKIAHMCHFSHKPHGKLCCGGEDLLYESITSPKNSIPADTCDTQTDRRLSELSSSRNRSKGSRSETRQRRRRSGDGSSSRRSSSLPVVPSVRRSPVPEEPESQDEEEEEVSECLECQRESSVQVTDETTGQQAVRSRSGSELSIASLPSTSSPVEVFIARGVLTDESDLDFDLLHAMPPKTPSEGSFTERGRVSGGLRSLVSCLVPGISYQKNSRTRSHRKKRPHESLNKPISTAISMEFSDNFKDQHIPASVYSAESDSRSRRKGLSTSPEDLDTGHESSVHLRSDLIQTPLRDSCSNISESNHNAINEKYLVANFIDSCTHSPDFLPDQDKRPISASTMTTSPEPDKQSFVQENMSADHRDSGIWSKVSTTASILQVELDVIAESENIMPVKESEGHLTETSGGRSSGYQRQDCRRSPFEPSSSSSLRSGRKCASGRKGRAPRPPAVHVFPNSDSLSCKSACRSFSPNARKRKSHKSRPAPSPPPTHGTSLLIRSLSEQRQLNVKNCLNAVPAFRSEVNLKAERQVTQSGNTTATEEGDTLYVSFDGDDGQHRSREGCTCFSAEFATPVEDPEFLSPPVSPPSSLPLPPPPDSLLLGCRCRDVSVQVSSFPSSFDREEDSGDEEEDYADLETEDDEDDSSADATVNYESEDYVGHSHSLVVCTSCGCHLFSGHRDGDSHTHPLSSCPSGGMSHNNNNHRNGDMRHGAESPSWLANDARGSPDTRAEIRASHCPSSCRWRNSYQRTFSLQFPVRDRSHPPVTSSPAPGPEDGQSSVTRSQLKSGTRNEFGDADLSAISLNLKALLSPHRDWVRCSMCRTEVCWQSATARLRLLVNCIPSSLPNSNAFFSSLPDLISFPGSRYPVPPITSCLLCVEVCSLTRSRSSSS